MGTGMRCGEFSWLKDRPRAEEWLHSARSEAAVPSVVHGRTAGLPENTARHFFFLTWKQTSLQVLIDNRK